MKLAITTDAISQDFETAVLLSLEWGIDCFEFKRLHHKRVPDVTPDEVKIVQNVVRAKAVQICSIAPGCFKVPLDRERVQAEQKRLGQSLELAERLSVRMLVVFGFEKDLVRSREDALPQVVDYLGAAAQEAARRGCVLCVENERGHWVENPRDLAWVVRQVNSPTLRINWDPGNVIGTGAEAPFPQGYTLIHDLISHMHIKDLQALPDGKHRNVMVGEGEVDWCGQLSAMLQAGYQGYAVIEPHFGCRIDSSRAHIVQTRRLLREATLRSKSK